MTLDRSLLKLGLALGLVFLGRPALSEDKPAEAAKAPEVDMLHRYPLAVCAISKEPLGSMGGPVVKVYEGREVKFCCSDCVKEFEKDPKKGLADLDTAIIAQQSSNYPLETCPISGEKLGSMGEPIVKVVGNRVVKLCCAGCTKKLENNPSKAVMALDAAVIKNQTPNYPLTTCVVSGKKLGEMGKPVDYVYRNQLVRFCCNGCPKAFEKDPEKYMAMIEEAHKGETDRAKAEKSGEVPQDPKPDPNAGKTDGTLKPKE